MQTMPFALGRENPEDLNNLASLAVTWLNRANQTFSIMPYSPTPCPGKNKIGTATASPT